MASRSNTSSNERSGSVKMALKKRLALLRRHTQDTNEGKATGSADQKTTEHTNLSNVPLPSQVTSAPEASQPKAILSTKVDPPARHWDHLEAGRISDDPMRPVMQSLASQIVSAAEKISQPTHTLPLLPVDAPASRASKLENVEIYKYNPIPDENSIRVLELLPGQGEEDIKIILRDQSLAQKGQAPLEPNFTALSYEWGIPEVSMPVSDGLQNFKFTARFLKRIFCDGKVIRVMLNLHNVLRQLRYPDMSRMLWIDGICIDQGNYEERGQQVSLMKEVYASASDVILWLGPEKENTIEAMSLIPELAQIFRGVDFGNPPRHQASNNTNQDIQYLNDKTKYGKAWLGLRDLFSRPYFTRIWIIQEILIPRSATIQCGSHRCKWEDFHFAYSFVENSSLLDQVVGQTISRATEEFRTYFSALASINVFVHRNMRVDGWRTLHNLLQNFRSHKVTDARDRVYGMLGLLDDSSSKFPAIVPDYKKSVQRVYQNATERSIQETQSFVLLDNLVNSTYFNELPSLSTWVPDLTSGPEKCGEIPFFAQFSRTISRLQPFQTPTSNEGSITTQAYILDRVGSFGEPLSNSYIPPLLLQLFWDYALQSSPSYPTLSMLEIIFYTFNPKATFAPLYSPRIKISTFEDFKNFCARSILDMFGLPQRLTGRERDLRTIALEGRNSNSEFTLFFEFPDDITTSTMLTEKTFGRQVFETMGKGYLGLGPPAPHGVLTGKLRLGALRIEGKEGAGVRSLDVVAILVGSQKLWILRPKGKREGRQCFGIVGDAYIYSVSQGFSLEKELGAMEMITIM